MGREGHQVWQSQVSKLVRLSVIVTCPSHVSQTPASILDKRPNPMDECGKGSDGYIANE